VGYFKNTVENEIRRGREFQVVTEIGGELGGGMNLMDDASVGNGVKRKLKAGGGLLRN